MATHRALVALLLLHSYVNAFVCLCSGFKILNFNIFLGFSEK